MCKSAKISIKYVEVKTWRCNVSIKIGNKNKIKKSTIVGSVINDDNGVKNGLFEKHPIIFGLFISLIAGILLLFSFWGNIILWIEELL